MAIFYTYSDFAVEIIKSNTSLHYLLPYAQHQGTLSFFLYSGVFVLTISTMQIGYIRFQLNQLCWTIVVLCLTVGQLKYIMHNGTCQDWINQCLNLVNSLQFHVSLVYSIQRIDMVRPSSAPGY